ncbi:50S ribosomal protein L32 [Candidatus Uhrbacteria bacterium]|nr:50S ribosomal protein L32 [Candidatus Uhrbacteria bacterium]
MGLPGKRLSSSSKRRRASHFAMKKRVLVACPQCKKAMAPHRVCVSCGTYKMREIVAPKARTKAEKK